MGTSELLDPRGQNMRDLSARTLDEVRLVPTETIKRALSALEKNLGGREVLATLLAESAFSSDEEKFVAILGDPEEASTPLAKLLGVFGLSPGRFFKMLMDAKQVRSTFASMDHIYRRLPEVAEHTVDRAIPSTSACGACDGVGRYPPAKEGEEGKLCQECRGAGSLRVVPEIEDVKLALQVGGLLKGGNTVTVTNLTDARSVTMNSTGEPSSDQRSIFKDFSQASDRVLYGRVAALPAPSADLPGATIQDSIQDAEVVEVQEEPPPNA